MKRLSVLVLLTALGCGSPDYDLIIEGATIVDGTGEPSYVGDVGVRADTIAFIGDLGDASATERVAASGLVLAPGFIDIHSHATSGSIEGSDIVERPEAENYVQQGVTTVLGGQDGASMADVAAFLSYMDDHPATINVGVFYGHGSLRARVMGEDDVPPTQESLGEMVRLVEQAMADGAFGLSSGLEYTPGAFASVDELAALSAPVAAHDGMYISHIRDEGGRLLESVDEVLEVGRRSGARVQVTHHKVIGKGRWGMASESLALIDAARITGVDAASDQYPYTASSTGLTILFPTWSKDGGFEALQARLADPAQRARIRADVIEHITVERGADPSTIVAARCGFDASFNGKSLADILTDRGEPVTVPGAADVALELVEAGSCSGVFHSMSDGDVATIMQHPWTSISSDGGIPALDEGVPHPRNYGAFARVLGRYVREDGVLSLEEAVRKMTALPAERLRLADRGTLAVGKKADLVVFDPQSIRDTALFGDPHHYAEGVHHVWVSGRPVLRDGASTGERPGKALRHGQ
ncbi:MAG: D-aminoacylase [Bacteroidetes bacterium]|nr:D-aminoacylase [Bacteroidota bacterium]